MDVQCGFLPVSQPNARVLILGSAPGLRSLAAGEYYAHPQNAFWDIMAGWTGCSRQQPYEHRLQALMECRIALWDVAHRFKRPNSSLDSRLESLEPVPLRDFLQAHPGISWVLLNGAKAHQVFLQKLLPVLQRELQWERLPSTSPAWAGLSRAEKQRQWLEALARTSALRPQTATL